MPSNKTGCTAILNDCASPSLNELAASDNNVSLVLARLLDRRSELGSDIRPRHRKQILRGVSRCNPQIAVCGPKGIQALKLAVDEDCGWRVVFNHQPSAKVGEGGLARGSLTLAGHWRRSHASADREAEVAGTGTADMAKEALGLGNDLELAVEIADGFGVAEKKNPAITQRKMKCRDCFRLGLRAQIDQEIPA